MNFLDYTTDEYAKDEFMYGFVHELDFNESNYHWEEEKDANAYEHLELFNY
jgi:hypothetical protein